MNKQETKQSPEQEGVAPLSGSANASTPVSGGHSLSAEQIEYFRRLGPEMTEGQLSKLCDMALASTKESEAVRSVVKVVRSHLIYKPYGTYFMCQACSQTWWDDRRFGSIGEYHKTDCWLASLAAHREKP